MIESRKTISILLLATLALVVVLIALALWPKTEAYSASSDQIDIFSYKTESIEEVNLQFNGRERTMIQKGGGWYLSDGTELDYDNTDLLVTFISYLYSDNLVEENAADLSLYGLKNPSAAAAFTLVDGTSHNIGFGNTAANGESVYMCVDTSSTVYTIPLEVYNIIFADIM